MTSHQSTLTRRHALQLSLLYLLIRGIPELASWVWVMTPDAIRFALAEGPAAWILRLLPPQPLGLFHAVPILFQYVFNSVSVLAIEVLLVFLFSAWLLTKRPWDSERKPVAKAWLIMALATLAWSVVLRHLVLGLLIDHQLEPLNAGLPLDELTGHLLRSYGLAAPLFYLTTVVWAGLPVWLHDRALTRLSGGAVHTVAMAPPLKQACVAASFALGFLLLHDALVQGPGFGLWSWVVHTKDIFIPTEELQRLSMPLVFSQLLAPTIAGALAAHLYSRNAHLRADTVFQLIVGPLLAGVAVLALTDLICLALLWLLFYIDYGLAAGVLLGVAYRPVVAYVPLVIFNLFSLVLLCCIAVFLRGPLVRFAYSAKP